MSHADERRSDTGPSNELRETILVADDDPIVRLVAVRVLAKRGYHMLEASDGRDALAIARGYAGEIALLLTDVVMPVMSGPVLAEHLRRERPRTRILFMSGYAEEFLGRNGFLHGEIALLAKPFDAAVLAQAVRAVLDAD